MTTLESPLLADGDYSCSRYFQIRKIGVTENRVNCTHCSGGDCISPIDQGIDSCHVWIDAFNRNPENSGRDVEQARQSVRCQLYARYDERFADVFAHRDLTPEEYSKVLRTRRVKYNLKLP